MLKLIRRLTSRGTVDFCEACGQVCTAQCRSHAHWDRTRTKSMQLPFGH
jgi:hypothetical protein